LEEFGNGTKLPFTFIFDDPSGNSYIKNPNYPGKDPKVEITHYKRTREQLENMGYSE